MTRQEAIKILERNKSHLKDFRVISLSLFGSVDRDEAVLGSDIDVVVRISKPDLFLLAGIKNELEERSQRPVDIVSYRENMNKFLKERIDREAAYV